jgi:glycosyltransferase involved in cell wall biosynthesis
MGLQWAHSGRLDQVMMVGDTSRPGISVLMSCFNAERWLEESIESILSQTYRNFELVLIDDGSTDDTWRIIQSYCQQDSRIVSISKPNTGLADSLNVGINLARGAWIARLDADDLCELNRLEEQLMFVRNNPGVVLLGSGCVEIDERGDVIRKHSYPAVHQLLLHHLESFKSFFPHSSVFFSTDLVRSLRGYNTRLKKSQDWDLWFRLSEKGKIGCLDKCLVAIRRHPQQLTHELAGNGQTHYARAACVCHFLRLSGAPDPSFNENDEAWSCFLSWMEKRLDQERVFDRRRAWAEARSLFFSANNRLTGTLRFGRRVLQSGHLFALCWERVFGSPLPQQLANEWMNRQCAEL